MLNNTISSALGRNGDPDLVRVCLFQPEIPGAVALQEQCSTVHAVISIMHRDALRLGLCKSPPIRRAKLSTLHAWTGDWRPIDQIKHCMCFGTALACGCVYVRVLRACQLIGQKRLLAFRVLTRLSKPGHNIPPLGKKNKKHSSLFFTVYVRD